MAKPIERILVVNVNWLGDVIFSTPVFKALKTKYPAARITCLAVPRVKEILQCVPGVDEILIYDEKGRDRGLFGKARIVQQLRTRKFDVAFLLHGSWTRAMLIFLSGIGQRVGYATKKGSRILTHPIPFLGDEFHKSDLYLNLLQAYGLTVSDRTCELVVPSSAIDELARILQNEGIEARDPYLVVHTSGNWALKRWPQKLWAELIERIDSEFKMRVIISEGANEVQWAQDIAQLSKVNPVVLAGKTNLSQLMALLQNARVVISADSGPLHIASCVSPKIIGIYGPTFPQTTGPRGQAQAYILHHDVGCNRASCYHLQCPDNVCMKVVTVEEVLAKVRTCLNAS